MRESRERFLFEPFCLDAATGVLTKDGITVSLGSIATELLLYLLRHSERLTTYEELEQALWPDSPHDVLLRNTLSQHIREVRTALGDNARHPHYVRTVHRKGYRFHQPVKRDEASGSAPHAPPDGGANDPGMRDILARLGVAASERIRHLLDEAILLIGSKGIGAEEVKDRLSHAMALCGEADKPYFFVALQGLCLYLIMGGKLQDAHRIGGMLLQLAEAMPAPIYAKHAHSTFGVILCYLGEYQKALGFLEKGPGLEEREDVFLRVSFTDLRVSRLCYIAHASYALGYPDRARVCIDQALEFARGTPHHLNTIFSRHFGAALYQLLRMPEETQKWADREMAISDEYRHQPWPAGGAVMQGWAMAMRGETERGIGIMEQAIADWKAFGARIALSRWHTLQAEAYGKAGDVAAGLRSLDTALAVMEDTGDRHYAAETYRIRGVLLLRQGTQAATSKREEALRKQTLQEAEQAFQEALSIAQQQQAKSFALRVAVSWGGHLATNHPDDARRLLGRIYHGWPEGSGTLDHQEAQALLQRISA